jgi:hypothetical protein
MKNRTIYPIVYYLTLICYLPHRYWRICIDYFVQWLRIQFYYSEFVHGLTKRSVNLSTGSFANEGASDTISKILKQESQETTPG